MADNEQSKVRYDDFVGRVQADPASPQSTIMLAGYAGHGPEGHIRIYPDPTLGNWYDVPVADIVHSMPIEDSKLGGSYVWIRSSAAIRPGNAAPQGPVPGAAPVAAAPHLQPTPTAVTLCADCGHTPATLCQPTPQTHCFICPPVTHNCTQTAQCPSHVICTHAPLCPIHTPACPIQSAVCVTPAVHCPPPPTPFCPSHPIICTHTQLFACPVTHPPGCPVPTQQPGLCPIVSNPAVCGPQLTTPQLTTPQFTPQFGQGGIPQAQAFAAPGPAPAAVPQAGGAGGQPPFSQGICPTPSAVQQCGQPPFSQGICPTPSAVQQCGQPQQSQAFFCQSPAFICQTPTQQLSQFVFCQTPTGQITQQVFCQQSLGIACLQTAQTPCLPQTLAGCPSIACTPQFTPFQNGVFTPFGR